jgi:hypothetical protein
VGGFFSPGTPQAVLPRDLQGMRQQNINLLQQLLGFPNSPPPAQSPFAGLLGGSMGGMGANLRRLQSASQAPAGGPAMPLTPSGDPLSRLQAFFGQLGVPQTDLQRQAGTGISQYLNQPAPEQRALDIALPGLQEILSGGGPQFEHDLSLANQSGGRFGSANAIMRGEALRNLYNQRGQAAQTLGMLSQSAGQNPFQRLLGGAEVGNQQAGQADIQTQRVLQLLMNLLGVSQQASFNVPTTQSPSPFSQLLGLAGGAAGLGWSPFSSHGMSAGPRAAQNAAP